MIKKLSDLIQYEGYKFIADDWRKYEALGNPDPYSEVALVSPDIIICPCDSWDYVYSVAHEIAEHRHDFQHTAEMFAEQANILARWLKELGNFNTCETCIHWVKPTWGTNNFGTCYLPSFRRNKKLPVAFRVIGGNGKKSIATHSTFGCIFHKSNE